MNHCKINSESKPCKSQFIDLDNQPRDVICLLCDSSFILPSNEKDFLSHLFQEHHLVIGDVYKIASLKSYIRYWKMKFKENPITEFCTRLTVEVNKQSSSQNAETNGKFYFLLSDCLMEDKILREELQQAKLEWVLAEQLKERTDVTFKRGCMFCRTEFSGSRIEYIKHLNQKHNILLGKPENLVFIDEYLDKIQSNIERFICIYCEKVFKNRLVLKEHMRKKLHKQVNPNNKEYDKFYITSYLSKQSKEELKSKKRTDRSSTVEEDPSGFSSDNEDENWSDWNNEVINIKCLFCIHIVQDFSAILEHMKLEHKFDFENVGKEYTFYQKVKIVNYIRKQTYFSRCFYCDIHVCNLKEHMSNENHYKLPSMRIWDQPEFYFPMFESDSFLYNLDTNSDSE